METTFSDFSLFGALPAAKSSYGTSVGHLMIHWGLKGEVGENYEGKHGGPEAHFVIENIEQRNFLHIWS